MFLPFDPAILLLRPDPKYKDVYIFLGLEFSGMRMKWREKSAEKYVEYDSLLLFKKGKKYRVHNYINTSKGVEGHNQTINTGYSKAQNWRNRKRNYYFPYISYVGCYKGTYFYM